ncbi:UDP-glucosyltransferase 2-like [Galleria mellonella]|uniref:UDP-glucuronosyltransferase n=1 Tax=Galleria mellonella TaxID=7137 RepID=A0ABM3MZ09_GALME|nr:UDP-glucosyltransferase 2-like [Galleria mellonella]XP_052756571.1 UDP-glucosyltransferase 2-like [Galleria mellonella]
MNKLCFLIFVFLNASFSESYKILVSFPVPSKSHKILGDGVVRHLVKAGHEVTYITPYPANNPPSSLRQIDISSDVNAFPDVINLKAILQKEVNVQDWRQFFAIVTRVANGTLSNVNVQRLLNDPNETFDLFITEWFFTEVQIGIAAVYDCPYIWVSTIEPHWVITRLVDEYLHPAYNSDMLLGSSPPFSFYERVLQLTSQLMMTAIKVFYTNGIEEKTYTDVFSPLLAKRGKVLPPYNEVLYNASLIIGNSHVSLGQATRLPQNYKSVGGYHIDDVETSLPEDLKQLLDNAKYGVIYFSMGSILKSKDMPDEIKTGLLRIFGELKYTILWKFEEALPNLPSNVHIIQWAPQQSILAHPNCILFITHGGLLSTTEAIHFGKPIIGIPAFADQFTNVDRMVKKGFAKKVDLSFTLAEDLKETIVDILKDPSYAKRAKELSFIYHDRPATPGAELVHWAEHVVRTRGAPHLRSPALHVPLHQKCYLDLVALLVACFILIRIVLRKLINLLFNRKKAVTKKKQN